jgi:hypothetical protein
MAQHYTIIEHNITLLSSTILHYYQEQHYTIIKNNITLLSRTTLYTIININK